MMSEKVKLVGDIAARRNIMASPDPSHQTYIGRSVSNYYLELWERQHGDIVLRGNHAKFSAPPLRQAFLDTGDKILAEASPYDLIWGIGLRSVSYTHLTLPTKA